MKLERETNCSKINHSAVGKTTNQLKMRKKRRHIPHAERPLEAVQKRNERERQRVNDVNAAFFNLLNHLPQHQTSSHQLTIRQTTRTVATVTASSSKMSKINILRQAIAYIDSLSNILQSPSRETGPPPAMSNLLHQCDSTLDEVNENILTKYYQLQNHQGINTMVFSSQTNGDGLTELHNTMINCYSQMSKLEHWSSYVMAENAGFAGENNFCNPPVEFLPKQVNGSSCSTQNF